MQASPYEPERRGQNASGGGRDSARNSIPAANVNRIQAALDGFQVLADEGCIQHGRIQSVEAVLKDDQREIVLKFPRALQFLGQIRLGPLIDQSQSPIFNSPCHRSLS